MGFNSIYLNPYFTANCLNLAPLNSGCVGINAVVGTGGSGVTTQGTKARAGHRTEPPASHLEGQGDEGRVASTTACTSGQTWAGGTCAPQICVQGKVRMLLWALPLVANFLAIVLVGLYHIQQKYI